MTFYAPDLAMSVGARMRTVSPDGRQAHSLSLSFPCLCIIRHLCMRPTANQQLRCKLGANSAEPIRKCRLSQYSTGGELGLDRY